MFPLKIYKKKEKQDYFRIYKNIYQKYFFMTLHINPILCVQSPFL